MKKGKYDVTGMTCSACSSRVDKAVRKLEGVNEVSVNLLTNSMEVSYDENVTSSDKIIEMESLTIKKNPLEKRIKRQETILN